jgi:hypothetical protein
MEATKINEHMSTEIRAVIRLSIDFFGSKESKKPMSFPFASFRILPRMTFVLKHDFPQVMESIANPVTDEKINWRRIH